jgi:outer membrane protein insertion porin family
LKTSLRNPFARVLLASIFLFSGASGLVAQADPATGQQAEGPVYRVGTVTIKFVGMANVSEQIVRANMALREDTELDEALIDRDIRSLYRTNLFEFIEVKREQVGTNVVNLVFEVTPKFRVLAIKFEGTKAFRDRRLLKETKSQANGPLDEPRSPTASTATAAPALAP